METTWVVVADQTRARFFTVSRPRDPLTELSDLVHPEGRLHDRDINADRPGRAFDSSGEGRHAMGKRHSPKDQEAIRFAERIGERLEKAVHDSEFDHLVLSAPPRFLGVLREALPETVANRVALSLDKDLAGLSPKEIREHLPERLPPLTSTSEE